MCHFIFLPTLSACINPPLKWKVLIPPSRVMSWIYTRRPWMTVHRTFSIRSSFRLLDGLSECALLSTEVWSCFKWLYYSLIWVLPMASLPKACWVFWIVCTWAQPSSFQTLLATSRLDAFEHLVWKRKSDECILHVRTIGVTADIWCGLSARNFSDTRRKNGVPYHPKDFDCTALILAELNKTGYYLNALYDERHKWRQNYIKLRSFHNII